MADLREGHEYDPHRAPAGPELSLLSSAQQLGNALGVALAGMVFFGAVSGGHAHALAWSLLALIGSTTGVALLATLLQRR